jgi:predicted transcriptional regulator of viral defense system/very-short-patch-repair endonuclease
MARTSVQHHPSAEPWKLVERQHGVISRAQLLGLGFSTDAIAHRIAKGRLHPVQRGVYAVGRPELSRHGRWMAAVMSCGEQAVLSHASAALLWGLRQREGRTIEVSVPLHVRRRRPGLTVYRRTLTAIERTSSEGVPVTTVHRTLLDLAQGLPTDQLEAAINTADKFDLTDPESLRAALDGYASRPGVAALRKVLDRRTFTLTDSELERRFLPLARRAGLPQPLTGRRLNGFKVDFFWPELGLVVETDGLRYHRTPAQQARDRLRDQAHVAAGLTPLRFTHAQVRYEPRYVQRTLVAVARRLGDV